MPRLWEVGEKIAVLDLVKKKIGVVFWCENVWRLTRWNSGLRIAFLGDYDILRGGGDSGCLRC